MNSNTYNLKVKLNGKEYEMETSDLKESIMSLKPSFLKTHVMFNITNDKGEICERIALSRRAKMMFKNEVYLDLFIKSLYFKPNG